MGSSLFICRARKGFHVFAKHVGLCRARGPSEWAARPEEADVLGKCPTRICRGLADSATQQAAGSDCRVGADLEVSLCLILLVLLLLELGHLVLVREEVVMLVLVVVVLAASAAFVLAKSRHARRRTWCNTANLQNPALTTKRRVSTSILVSCAPHRPVRGYKCVFYYCRTKLTPVPETLKRSGCTWACSLLVPQTFRNVCDTKLDKRDGEKCF